MNISCYIVMRIGFALTAVVISHEMYAQETVFSLTKRDAQKADQYFEQKNYRKAAALYESLSKQASQAQYYLSAARSYYHLREPRQAVYWFQKYLATETQLTDADTYAYAECLASCGRYDEAVGYYTEYASRNDDAAVMKKAWQIKNREFLLEDSLHFEVRSLNANTPSAEFGAVPYGNGFVFLSNRKHPSLVENLDGASSAPFLRWYETKVVMDSAGTTQSDSRIASFFDNGVKRFQAGPVSFFNGENEMAFIASNPGAQKHEKRTLQLFFARNNGTAWTVRAPFPYNSNDYSISAVSVHENGTVMYLAADMPGGTGGVDLYVSVYDGKTWSRPRNLGTGINTAHDESFPWIAGNTLYFASTGHPGLGGFDVFKAAVSGNEFGEVENVGYPINTQFDDFALTLTRDYSTGFLSSNRQGSDDLYEVVIGLQTYPITIAGILRHKEEAWQESGLLTIFPNAEMELIDNLRGIVVGRTRSDEQGGFNLEIPYYSQYRIKVVDSTSGDQAFVSLDLGKRRYGENKFELVVVKSKFKGDN